MRASRSSPFHRPFKEKTLRQERRCDVLRIVLQHAAREEMIPPVSHDGDDAIDFRARCFNTQPESLARRKQVVDARGAAVTTYRHGEIALLDAH